LAAFLRELNRYTLADLIAPRRKLAALLHLRPASPRKAATSTHHAPPARARARATS
jgi:hypothetical protein